LGRWTGPIAQRLGSYTRAVAPDR